MVNATINTSATEFSPTWLKVNNVTVDKGSITKPDGIIYKIITSGTHNGHYYTWNGQMYVKAEIERHVRNPKSLMVGYEQLDNPPANMEVYGPEIDFRYQDFNNDFDIKDPVVYPYIQGGSVPPSDEMSKTDNTFKPKFINVQGNTYELKPKKPKIETKATIRSGASTFSATWLNEITQTSGVSNPNVYKITTSGEYKNKCYKWNGSQYIQAESFGYGEMAVNFSVNNETIFVRNSNDEIVEIGKSNTCEYVDFVGSHELVDGTSSVGRGGLVPAPDKPDMFLSSSGGWENRSHCHGNVTNEGSVQGNPVNVQTGDGLLVTKASEYNKIVKADITFDKTVNNEYLRRDGTWAVPPGGGGGTDYKTKLNGANYPSTPATGATSLGEWYAPTSGQPSSGSATNQVLLSKGTGNSPEWTSLTLTSSTSGVFRWNSSAWELKNLQTRYQLSGNYPILTRAQNNLNDGDLSYFNNKAFLNHNTGEITLEDTLQIKISPDNSSIPLKISTWNSSAWSPIQNSLITCNGLITPNSSTDINKFLQYTSNGFSWSASDKREIKINNTQVIAPSSNNAFNLIPSRYIDLTAEQSSDEYTGNVTLSANMHAVKLDVTPSSETAIGLDETTIPELCFYSKPGISFSSIRIDSTGYSRYGLGISLKPAATNEIGGVKVAGVSVSSAGRVAPSGTYYPIETTSSGQACVKVPTFKYNVASIYGHNPGLLQVTADGGPRNVFINNTYIDAIPVFYGYNNDTIIWTYKDDSESYAKNSYVDEPHATFSGHYVNIADVVNGLVRNHKLLALLRDRLQEIWNPEE